MPLDFVSDPVYLKMRQCVSALAHKLGRNGPFVVFVAATAA